MTGFGRGSHIGQRYRVQVEMRSVNHRFREIVVRVPAEWQELTERVRARVAERIERGRVDVFIALEALPGTRQLKVDTDLAVAYYRALEGLREHLGLETPITFDHLLHFSDILVAVQDTADPEAVWLDVEPAVEAALDGLCAMREQEGQALAKDFAARLDRIARAAEVIAARAPMVVEAYRQRLTARVSELMVGTPIDQERLRTEVVLFAERSDIEEELVRLRSHLDQLQRALTETGPIGRRLEFLLQEVQREVNTMGAKAHDAQISAVVVELKTELEKLREQAQNVE